MAYGEISPKLYIKLHNDYKRPRSLWTCGGARMQQCFDSRRLSSLLIRRRPWQERKSSEVIFVIPLVAAASPSSRGFPRCLISHINHAIFMTITRAAVASVLRGGSVENNMDWRLSREQSVSSEREDVFPSALRNVMSVQRQHALVMEHNGVKTPSYCAYLYSVC